MTDIVSFWKDKWEKALYGGQYAEKEVAELVAKLLQLSGNETLLDVGCGGGLLLANLPAREKHGIDYSVGRVEKARENNPGAKIVAGEAASLPYPNDFFDRVLSHSTFLYYPPDYALKALNELERVCKNGGIILVGDVTDVDKYPGGRLVYALRTKLLELIGKGHYTCFTKEFFTTRGYTISLSPFNNRFYACKIKVI